jgi:hypothetical protein
LIVVPGAVLTKVLEATPYVPAVPRFGAIACADAGEAPHKSPANAIPATSLRLKEARVILSPASNLSPAVEVGRILPFEPETELFKIEQFVLQPSTRWCLGRNKRAVRVDGAVVHY